MAAAAALLREPGALAAVVEEGIIQWRLSQALEDLAGAAAAPESLLRAVLAAALVLIQAAAAAQALGEQFSL